MRIKFLTSIAGTNFSYKPGDEIDWPDETEAARFVAAGYASSIETAARQAPERADGRRGQERATLSAPAHAEDEVEREDAEEPAKPGASEDNGETKSAGKKSAGKKSAGKK
ncbi:MAG: hypothetical protein ACKVW3_12945 [Phycisphaerales bacterium]